MTVNYMTEEGYRKLQKELRDLENQRPEIAQQISDARDKGDLSENAEYDAAKEAQGFLELKISQVKNSLATVRLIDQSQIATDEVQILNKVKLKNLKTDQVVSYFIVSETEANFKEGKIAVKTPIAQGLLGKKVGDKAKIQVPSGVLEFEILDISL